MEGNKAFIPLYLNNEIVNNLFTIVVQEFVDSKSMSTKDQITISYKVPMSEFSYEIFGKYVQGDINVQILNEASKQKTNTAVSKNIEIFMNLRDLLLKNKLLRYIDNNEPIYNIHENDFIVVNCQLMQNPIYNYLQNIINKIEMKKVFGNLRADSTIGDQSEILKGLCMHMEDWKHNRCIKHLTNEFCNPKSRFIVPIEHKHSIANMEYITGGRVNIMGKVINTLDTSNTEYCDLVGDTFLNFIHEDYFSSFVNNFVDIEPVVNAFNSGLSINNKILELLPIAIFL